MSEIAPAPTESPLEAPNAWMTRQNMSDGTLYASATPIEPTHRHGREHRYIGLRPSGRFVQSAISEVSNASPHTSSGVSGPDETA